MERRDLRYMALLALPALPGLERPNAPRDEEMCVIDLTTFVRPIAEQFRTLPETHRAQALQLLTKELRPAKARGGRGRSEAVTRLADEVRADMLAGRQVQWSKICPRYVPSYWALSAAEKRVQRTKLIQAVKARVRREKSYANHRLSTL